MSRFNGTHIRVLCQEYRATSTTTDLPTHEHLPYQAGDTLLLPKSLSSHCHGREYLPACLPARTAPTASFELVTTKHGLCTKPVDTPATYAAGFVRTDSLRLRILDKKPVESSVLAHAVAAVDTECGGFRRGDMLWIAAQPERRTKCPAAQLPRVRVFNLRTGETGEVHTQQLFLVPNQTVVQAADFMPKTKRHASTSPDCLPGDLLTLTARTDDLSLGHTVRGRKTSATIAFGINHRSGAIGYLPSTVSTLLAPAQLSAWKHGFLLPEPPPSLQTQLVRLPEPTRLDNPVERARFVRYYSEVGDPGRGFQDVQSEILASQQAAHEMRAARDEGRTMPPGWEAASRERAERETREMAEWNAEWYKK